MPDVTVLLGRIRDGDEQARHELAPLVYGELKRLAVAHVKREHRDPTVRATELVSDAYMRLIDQVGIDWESRGHFYGIASRIMRQILVDRARARNREMRGGGAVHVSFDEVPTIRVDDDEHILAVEEALTKLQATEPQHASIVIMRFYGGLSMREVADALGVSKRTADREWALIKAWMRRELSA